jgi:hypothetical protein
MLRHGLQGMHGQSIQVPGRNHQRPDTALLERRHNRFLELSANPDS